MKIWRAYCLPAIVFQSVMIGGGYGTGREIVEYFTSFGIGGGLLGLGLVTAGFALLLALSFEFARVFRAYDYRRFVRAFLGRGWILFELLYLIMFALVLAVIAAASSDLVEQQLGVPGEWGVAVLLAIVTLLAFYGRQWVMAALAFKAVFVCVVFGVYFVLIFTQSNGPLMAELSRFEVRPEWWNGALKYWLYSTVVAPAILFSTTGIETRQEALSSGVVAAIFGMAPGVWLHLSFGAGYPDVLQQAIPVHWMIDNLGYALLMAAYLAMLFTCLLDTGVCFIQSVNERLDGWREESGKKPISPVVRALVAIVCVAVSGALSFFGVINLIAQGYGAMAWGFLFLFVGPMLTVGVYRLIRNGNGAQTAGAS